MVGDRKGKAVYFLQITSRKKISSLGVSNFVLLKEYKFSDNCIYILYSLESWKVSLQLMCARVRVSIKYMYKPSPVLTPFLMVNKRLARGNILLVT